MRGISRSRQCRLLLVTLLGGVVFLYASQSRARQLYDSGSTYADLGATFKNLFLGNRYYEIPFVEDRTQVTDYHARPGDARSGDLRDACPRGPLSALGLHQPAADIRWLWPGFLPVTRHGEPLPVHPPGLGHRRNGRFPVGPRVRQAGRSPFPCGTWTSSSAGRRSRGGPAGSGSPRTCSAPSAPFRWTGNSRPETTRPGSFSPWAISPRRNSSGPSAGTRIRIGPPAWGNSRPCSRTSIFRSSEAGCRPTSWGAGTLPETWAAQGSGFTARSCSTM